MKVAVLTKNERLFKLTCDAFSKEEMLCVCFADDQALVRELPRQSFELLIVDAHHHDFTPYRPLNAWRECYGDRRTPIIVVGLFFNQEGGKEMLATQADDFIFGPLNPRELHARAYRLLSRDAQREKTRAQIREQGYTLDKNQNAVFFEGERIRLTAREFAIAWLFFSHPGHFFSRQKLAETIWGNSEEVVGRTLEQHIYKLRKKLGLTEHSRVQLHTLYAFGYRLNIEVAVSAKTQRSQEMATEDCQAKELHIARA